MRCRFGADTKIESTLRYLGLDIEDALAVCACACAWLNIEHRFIKPKHPWTNGQVEPMDRAIKDATAKRFHHEDHDQLWSHLASFDNACTYARRLKTLKGLTRYEAICRAWTQEPSRFTRDPLQQMPGLNG